MNKAELNNNNTVTMILDQAKKGREVIGTVVSVVPDNKLFEVTKVDKENKALTLTEQLEEGCKETPETVVLTQENAHIGHYVKNPNDRPVPDAIISDGAMKINDKLTVNIGTLDIFKVLGGVKGNVLLLIAASDGETLDLVAYNVQADKFETLIAAYCDKNYDVELYTFDADCVYLRKTLIVDEEREDEDGNKEVYKRLVCNQMSRVSVSYTSAVLVEESSEDEDDDDADDNDAINNSFPLISNAYVIQQAGRRDLVIISTQIVDDGEVKRATPRMILYRIDRSGAIREEIASYDVTSSAAKAYLGGPSSDTPVITIKDADKVMITTGAETLTIRDADVVKALEGYNYFDGAYSYTDPNTGSDGTIWYYSNTSREEISFKSLATDRGTLFELSK
jgi:hypothetical protein